MKIKGTAVKITPEYISRFHNNRYNEWLENLPNDSKNILSQPVIPTDWYPLTDSVTIPTRVIAKMFFNNDEAKAASELGKYSAEVALKGVYKIFVMISTPAFMISRASSIFSTYYQPSDIKIVESTAKSAVLEIKGFSSEDSITSYRIAGWIEKALEFVKKKNIIVKMNEISDQGQELIRLELNWD